MATSIPVLDCQLDLDQFLFLVRCDIASSGHQGLDEALAVRKEEMPLQGGGTKFQHVEEALEHLSF